MSVNHSTREPVGEALGATITSTQGRVFSSPGLLPADLGETVAPSRSAINSGADTRREPVAPISGVDQTAISDPSQPPLRTAIEDVIFERRGEPGRIQRFEVLRRLGTGGMGVVYAAYDWELERRLAIKVVRDDSASEASRRRMKREAQAMAKVSHPNVVQVYEVGEWAGQMYVAMEYIKGKNLADWLEAEERTWQEILEVYVQAGRGLAAAHRQGLVHRDFKPENVLVDTDNRARVLDFGLARSEGLASAADTESALIDHRQTAEESVNLTLAGAIMGTPAFMSPEQHLGRLADARSDQFSFYFAQQGKPCGTI
jgi:serine/threonine protein kinase